MDDKPAAFDRLNHLRGVHSLRKLRRRWRFQPRQYSLFARDDKGNRAILRVIRTRRFTRHRVEAVTRRQQDQDEAANTGELRAL